MKITYVKKERNKYITVGDIISCKAFVNGISNVSTSEIQVGFPEEVYPFHLKTRLKQGQGEKAYDLSRGEAFFLVLSMEIVEVILPDDVERDTKYIGINLKCIRLIDDVFLRESERIFFTLNHPMSCLDLVDRNIKIIGHLDLPIFYDEKSNNSTTVEKSF